MIPNFDPMTGYLPVGIHHATWEEVIIRFVTVTNPRRLFLAAGLYLACRNLADAGCTWLYLDGSFVTTKP